MGYTFAREFITKEVVESSDSQTKTIELPKSGIVNKLLLKLKATNGTTSNTDNRLYTCISKVEVLGDSSEVITSLTGAELHRLTWRYTKKFPACNYDESGSATQTETFVIPFGRYDGDLKYGLNLAKYNRTDLRITYNLGTNTAVSATTAYATGTFTHSVIAYRASADKGIQVVGFVKSHEVETWTTVSSGDYRTELPIGNRYKEIMVYAREAGVADATDITDVKLEVNSGEAILFSSRWTDLMDDNSDSLGIECESQGIIYAANDADRYTMTGDIKQISISLYSSQSAAVDIIVIPSIDTIAGDKFTTDINYTDISSAGAYGLSAYTSSAKYFFKATGTTIGNCVFIPFDLAGNEELALDSSKYAKVEVVSTQGGAGATAAVVVEEYKMYIR